MSNPEQDQIHIRDLLLRCILGIRDWERRQPQNVNLNIDLYTDLLEAGRSDRIEDTVDYVEIKKKVIDLVEGSSFLLMERLAQRVAEVCLENDHVARVRVMLEKPGALRFARTVSVEIIRDKSQATDCEHE
jgi:D-erythro-7,8-dihydroneopterin triphosphate epimerase